MKIRYALALPLLHLAIAAPPTIHQQSREWRFIPEMQAAEDFDKSQPKHRTSGMPWDACYEYRLPSDGRVLISADFPVAVLIGLPADECAFSAISLIPNRLKYYIRLKTRVLFVDGLLALGIFVQWWLIGAWLDQRFTRSKPAGRWFIPVAVITIGAIVMALTAFGQQGVAEILNYCAGMITLLAWIVLVVMLAAVGTRSVIRGIRREAPQA